jgi:hypothetical protein
MTNSENRESPRVRGGFAEILAFIDVLSADADGALAARIASHPAKKKPALRCGLEE